MKAQILITLPLNANYGGAFCGLMYVLLCPEKLGIHHRKVTSAEKMTSAPVLS